MTTSAPPDRPVAEALPPAFDASFQARVPRSPSAGARAALELAASGARPGGSSRAAAAIKRAARRGAVTHVLEAGERSAKVRSRQTIIVESIGRDATLRAGAAQADSRELRPRRARGPYPYRQQEKNRALVAREADLGPWPIGSGTAATASRRPQGARPWSYQACRFRNQEKGTPDAKSAIEGARDILVERAAEHAGAARAWCAVRYFERGSIGAAKSVKAKPHSRFESYFAFHERIEALCEPPAHAPLPRAAAGAGGGRAPALDGWRP